MDELMKFLSIMNNKYFMHDLKQTDKEMSEFKEYNEKYSKKYGQLLAVNGIIGQNEINSFNLEYIFMFYCVFPLQIKLQVRCLVNNDFNIDGLRYYYAQTTCKYISIEPQIVNSLIESAKQLGVYKDIKINNNKITFTLPDDRTFTVESIKSSLIQGDINNRCYDVVDEYVHSNEKVDAICGMIQTSIFGKSVQHISIVNGEYLEDYTQGIKIKLSEYWNTFNFEILFIESKEEVLNNIDKLNYSDKEFKEYPENEISKYFTIKHMNKYGES